jgi:putative RNA 2'-phosphotransferase
LKGIDYKTLSKTIAHALRHDPVLYGLELDKEGWVGLRDVVKALRKRYNRWQDLDVAEIMEMNNTSPKKRFEIKEDKIRALYGHSGNVKIEKPPILPPEKLYHGTSRESYEKILVEGLHAMDRQFVHLSADWKTAWNVGKRKTDKPVILVIDAKAAAEAGILFYLGNDTVWLADFIASEFIKIEDN